MYYLAFANLRKRFLKRFYKNNLKYASLAIIL